MSALGPRLHLQRSDAGEGEQIWGGQVVPDRITYKVIDLYAVPVRVWRHRKRCPWVVPDFWFPEIAGGQRRDFRLGSQNEAVFGVPPLAQRNYLLMEMHPYCQVRPDAGRHAA